MWTRGAEPGCDGAVGQALARRSAARRALRASCDGLRRPRRRRDAPPHLREESPGCRGCRRRIAARAGGVGRPEAGLRLQDGHLPHVHLPEALGDGAQRADRRDEQRGGRGDPPLRQHATLGRDAGSLSRGERPMNTAISNDAPRRSMSAEEIAALGAELEAIRRRVEAEVGEDDARYIRRIVATQRLAEIGGRALLFAGALPPAWVAGTMLLSLS